MLRKTRAFKKKKRINLLSGFRKKLSEGSRKTDKTSITLATVHRWLCLD